jgi:hypothetical protein
VGFSFLGGGGAPGAGEARAPPLGRPDHGGADLLHVGRALRPLAEGPSVDLTVS